MRSTRGDTPKVRLPNILNIKREQCHTNVKLTKQQVRCTNRYLSVLVLICQLPPFSLNAFSFHRSKKNQPLTILKKSNLTLEHAEGKVEMRLAMQRLI